jgi:ABC-type phosphate/phosphonate transport system substrate-binding protein
MRPVLRSLAALLAAAILSVPLADAAPAATAPATLVVCAPGSPGTTQEAQPAMDAFAKALAARATLPAGSLAATYAATEDAGVARLREKDAALALVSLPFFLRHEKALRLEARLSPVLQGGEASERWSLVARKGAVVGPASLDGFTILSSAGFAPEFVRGTALGAWGKLPAGAKVSQSTAVLSALRRAAAGEPVAVLLDGAQSAALRTLPTAKDLEVVVQSPPLPAGILATVAGRVPPARWAKLAPAFRELPSDPTGAEALAGIRMARFVPLDEAALAQARQRAAEAAR